MSVIINVGNNAVIIDTAQTPPGLMTLPQAQTAINNLTAYVAWYNGARGKWRPKTRRANDAGPNSPAKVTEVITDIYKALNVNSGIRASNLTRDGVLTAADKRYIDANLSNKPADINSYVEIHNLMNNRVQELADKQAKLDADAAAAARGKKPVQVAEGWFTWETIFSLQQYVGMDTTTPFIVELRKGYLPQGVPVSQYGDALKRIDDEYYNQGVMKRQIATAQQNRLNAEAETQRQAKAAEDKRIADEAARIAAEEKEKQARINEIARIADEAARQAAIDAEAARLRQLETDRQARINAEAETQRQTKAAEDKRIADEAALRQKEADAETARRKQAATDEAARQQRLKDTADANAKIESDRQKRIDDLAAQKKQEEIDNQKRTDEIAKQRDEAERKKLIDAETARQAQLKIDEDKRIAAEAARIKQEEIDKQKQVDDELTAQKELAAQRLKDAKDDVTEVSQQAPPPTPPPAPAPAPTPPPAPAPAPTPTPTPVATQAQVDQQTANLTESVAPLVSAMINAGIPENQAVSSIAIGVSKVVDDGGQTESSASAFAPIVNNLVKGGMPESQAVNLVTDATNKVIDEVKKEPGSYTETVILGAVSLAVIGAGVWWSRRKK